MKTSTIFAVFATASVAAAGPVGLTTDQEGAIIAIRAPPSQPGTIQEESKDKHPNYPPWVHTSGGPSPLPGHSHPSTYSPYGGSPQPPLPAYAAYEINKPPRRETMPPMTPWDESERASWKKRVRQLLPGRKSSGDSALQRRGSAMSAMSSVYSHYYPPQGTSAAGYQQLAKLPPPPEEPEDKHPRVPRLIGLPEEIDEMDKDKVFKWCFEACMESIPKQLGADAHVCPDVVKEQGEKDCNKLCRLQVDIQHEQLRKQAERDARHAADIAARKAAYEKALKKAYGHT
ncbi:hypothetical protein MGG_06123 [Pyricularia oryzae 70-15]|uniref:Extracellular membrane protein CFEM domain-containing protein n=3 Tax=Pyricularia oryzae TaxID=318829 RepID=G4N5J0_PYRO7|nr:uncharacterized protein MGG_06123 [Pyricularia oryzae 70-15]EHA52183.1 hypothetical protein MGG_06123 [Pyricularia oryzae 70-15]ELQ43476.1 hypothetical protein OOU_Y34scaffold00149g3 [Pyricularia oryzae Y34]KAI7920488.1 hypothetical protein M0657_006566 [Pyricularia oryzae]KAI7921822.1 hypothetical protein M9X92_005213 [Pyricularia oryzae]